LLALWPLVTSHVLLQHFGLIHEVHENHDGSGGSHEHGSDDHEFAHGSYRNNSHGISILKMFVAASAFPFGTELLFAPKAPVPEVFHRGLAPPGTGPPELLSCWQFFFRTALPVRAPSFLF